MQGTYVRKRKSFMRAMLYAADRSVIHDTCTYEPMAIRQALHEVWYGDALPLHAIAGCFLFPIHKIKGPSSRERQSDASGTNQCASPSTPVL